ncbi:MAG: hypothetical protein ACXAEF_08680 [Candidatus Thorarchaeota archaeon]|jgi:hypothetical protein
MRIRKWLMKQQWRIVQIRGIWSLFYGILLLAIAYFEFIPVFAAMGMLGPFVFAGTLLFIFLILGYIYDRVLVMWAPSQEVTMERNPYQYVPSPKEHIFWFPLYSAMLDSVEKVAQKFDVDTEPITAAKEYYSKLEKMRPEIKEDLDRAVALRTEFMSKNRIWDSDGQ